jgi:hypothetical protein
MVGLGRFELPTSPLSGVRSNQLSYRPGTHAGQVQPGCSHSCLQASRKGFEDQENMLASYAGDDHRLFAESREGLIQAPSI